MTTPTIDTPQGARVDVIVHSGHVPDQYRPLACRTWGPDPSRPGHYSYGCKCGKCNGFAVVYTGTYKGTTYYADNSVEGVVELDQATPDGKRFEVVRFVAPHGDRC